MHMPFPQALTGHPSAKPTVCIVSNEIVGPFKNGGIGTSMTGLAETLGRTGHHVTVYYTGAVWTPDVDLGLWRDKYRAIGVELVYPGLADLAALGGVLVEKGYGVPYLVYRYLRGRRFDVIHFNDCGGEGVYCLVAKRLGLAFADSLLMVALHSPSQWVLELNNQLPNSILYAAYNYAERVGISCADVLWGPSSYLLEWAAEHGFVFPERTYRQQYVIPSRDLFAAAALPQAAPSRRAPVVPKEFVFFGRLEERKGLRVFCNAIQRLNETLTRAGIAVTFLGKPAPFAGMTSTDYIAHRAEAWTFPWQVVGGLGQQEAVRYLQAEGRVAVMPSPFDNSPCTVYEALTFGFPFLAARTGGIPELIAAEDHAAVLCGYSTEALAGLMARALQTGVPQARPAFSQAENRDRWLAVHGQWRGLLPAVVNKPYRPGVPLTVVIDHSGTDAQLQRSLTALPADAVGSVVVIHRPLAPARLAAGTLSIAQIRMMEEDPAAVLDAVVAAPGDVLFLQSGVEVVADAFAQLLDAAAASPGDGLVLCAYAETRDGKIIPPLGGSPAFSLFEGVVFSGGVIVKRDALLRVCSDRRLAAETEFLGMVDYVAAAGCSLWPYPEPVLIHPCPGRCGDQGQPLRIAAYSAAAANDLYYMTAFGYAGVARPQAGAWKRELAMSLSNQGLGWMVPLGLRLLRAKRRLGDMRRRLRRRLAHVRR